MDFRVEYSDRLLGYERGISAVPRDRQIEADILAGRLDSAGRRADEELEAGRCTPLSP